ncbi:MAG: hypothetical protein AB1742_01550 [bacterium]
MRNADPVDETSRRIFRRRVPFFMKLLPALFLLVSLKPLSCSPSAGTEGLKGGADGFFSKELIGNYLKLSDALAGDSTKGLGEAAGRIVRLTDPYMKKKPAESGDGGFAESARIINRHAGLLAGEGVDLETARRLFAVVSDEFSRLFSTEYKGADRDAYHVFYCPMAGHYWVQKDAEARNPYLGSGMLRCGSEVEEARPAAPPPAKHEGMEHEGGEGDGGEDADPFSVVDAPPSPRAESLMREMKCACCGKPLHPATCGCARNLGMKVKNRIEEMEEQGLSDGEMIERLRAEFGKSVVPEKLNGRESK